MTKLDETTAVYYEWGKASIRVIRESERAIRENLLPSVRCLVAIFSEWGPVLAQDELERQLRYGYIPDDEDKA